MSLVLQVFFSELKWHNRWKVKGSSLRFVLRETWMALPNVIAIYPNSNWDISLKTTKVNLLATLEENSGDHQSWHSPLLRVSYETLLKDNLILLKMPEWRSVSKQAKTRKPGVWKLFQRLYSVSQDVCGPVLMQWKRWLERGGGLGDSDLMSATSFTMIKTVSKTEEMWICQYRTICQQQQSTH